MSLDSFPWDDIGNPNKLRVIDHAHSIGHSYSGGYSARRNDGTKIQKSFTIQWLNLSPAQWVALVEFFRSVGSYNPFYFSFPIELYGSPGYGGYGGIEPDDGFDADQDVGYGDSPVFTCWFESDDLSQDYDFDLDGWVVEVVIKEVA